MNERNAADIIDAIVADHRTATRRIRARLAETQARERARAEATAQVPERRPGVVLRSAGDARPGDDEVSASSARRDRESQRPRSLLS
ncbi:MAG: hypothetical protein WBA00_16265 [Rhodococcus sp. (in: high G+C Gram-positive bacteria)]